MNPFAVLNQALTSEGVFAIGDLAALVPHQHFFENTAVATQWLFKEWNIRRKNPGRIFMATDDVGKKVDGSGEKLDSLLKSQLQQALQNAPGCELVPLSLAKITDTVPGTLHASNSHMPSVRAAIAGLSENDLVLVVGSGTATDLVKHALFLEQSPATFAVFPTALTVTAFTSSFSVLDEGGAKRTRPSRALNIVGWVGAILSAAPVAMTRAGYGDLLARFVAMGDWYLSSELNLIDTYDERAYRLMESFASTLRADAAGFAVEIPPSPLIERTAAALSMAGVAMSVSGQTTPLSGFEHVISHGLDFLNLTAGVSMPYHGEQVALASLSSSMAFEWFLSKDVLEPQQLVLLTEKDARKTVAALLQQAPFPSPGPADTAALSLALEEFQKEFCKKNERWNELGQQGLQNVQKRWPEVRAKLRTLVMPAAEMEGLLRAALLPVSPEQTSPSTSAAAYRWAVRFAPFIRARPSLVDALFFFGEDPALVCAC